MPRIMAAKAAGRGPVISSYVVSLFDSQDTEFDVNDDGASWDGLAALAVDRNPTVPKQAIGTVPADDFQRIVVPYWPWNTIEYVATPGSERLRVDPTSDLPLIRSGYTRANRLIVHPTEGDWDRWVSEWLEKRAPATNASLDSYDGFGYVINVSQDPTRAPYAGLEELYFPNDSAWRAWAHSDDLLDDAFGSSQTYLTHTEFIGI